MVGDCLVGAAFLSYAGPFLSDYRDELVQDTWLKQVEYVTYVPIECLHTVSVHVQIYMYAHAYVVYTHAVPTCIS